MGDAFTVTSIVTPQQILQRVFGYPCFRGQQAEIIHHIISGQSCAVLMPTGSGKSLCYQIPALCMRGVGIVVSPLIALMDDQVNALRELGVRAGAMHSGLSREAVAEVQRQLHDGTLDLLYVAPERLLAADFMAMLMHVPLALFAIDEAHCISQWGHDFRPEYQQLAMLRDRFPHVPCIAVTATADAPTRTEIMEKLSLPRLFVAGFDRPNIHYTVGRKFNAGKQLLDFLQSQDKNTSGIVYCLSRKRVDRMAEFLSQRGYRALPYHAGMDAAARAENQNRFLKEEGVIIVATIAFGMGINKPDVRFVAHLDLPKSIEAYYQETGRAGRDGMRAIAWMIYGMQDVALQRQMIEDSDMPTGQKRIFRHKLDTLLGYCDALQCRRQNLLRYFGDEIAPCGNCDVCENPPQSFDGTVAAQKLLSCIYRTGQRFGLQYVTDVLLGKADERIRRNGHDQISTFGIGKEHDRAAWQSIARQLVSHNLIFVDTASHSEIKITAEGAAFLKEKKSIALRIEEKQRSRARSEALKSEIASANKINLSNADNNLLQALKDLRMSLARQQNLPPYVIFHDKTLIEMAARRPATRKEMATIPGIGQAKLEKYGDAFLDVICAA